MRVRINPKQNLKEKANLEKEHINSLTSFRGWIREVTGDYEERAIPNGELEKYLGYIRSVLDKTVGSNKWKWIKAIEKLQEKLKKES